MRLWLWYVPGTDEQIAAACAAAEEELDRRSISIGTAFQATVSASEIDENSGDDALANATGVAAWFAAEHAAFTHIAAATGEWPLHGALIVIEDAY